ncbi:MmyB family transcriptional regulator [Nocardia sp. NPDC004340]
MLIDELAEANFEFRQIWATQVVDVSNGRIRRYRHPLAGEIVLHSERLDIINDPDQVLFTYSPVPGSPSDVGRRKLA